MFKLIYNLIIFLSAIFFLSCEGFRYESSDPPTTGVYYIPENPFTIFSPSYKQHFKPGYDLVVEWDSSPKIKSVNIDMYKATTFQFNLAKGIYNSRNFRWLIPSDLKESVKYNIKISNADNENEFIFSDHFGIYE